jgi:hypothetical protein
MQVVNSQAKLKKYWKGLLLRKLEFQAVVSILINVSLISQLHGNVEVFAVFEVIVETNDIRMAQLSVNSNLIFYILHDFLVNVFCV